MLNGNGHWRFSVIGRAAGEHFIHDDAQRIEIRSGVHLGSLGLLR